MLICACLVVPSQAATTALPFETVGQKLDLSKLANRTDDPDAPVVYYTSAINAQALLDLYKALGRQARGRVAVKISTGEAGNTHYLSPQLIGPLVKSVNGTIVECNTAYGGARASTESHLKLAAEHGFTEIAQVDIMDAEGSLSLPVTGGTYLKEDLVGSHLSNYDFVMVLSHFKGHAMGGYGGALKNISIGIASTSGKHLIHSAGHSRDNAWGYNQGAYTRNHSDEHMEFIYAMAEAAKAVIDFEDHGARMLYINVLNHLSVDCDCDGSPSAPDMHDIGMIASLDPVAADQAGLDLIWAAPDSASLKERVASRRGPGVLKHAEELGLGRSTYRLVSLDK